MTTTWTFNYPNARETYVAHLTNAQTLEDFIEEQLYVLWEMTPVNRDWYKELRRNILRPSFRYSFEPAQVVEIDKILHLVTVFE